jgi:hypothetical protein
MATGDEWCSGVSAEASIIGSQATTGAEPVRPAPELDAQCSRAVSSIQGTFRIRVTGETGCVDGLRTADGFDFDPEFFVGKVEARAQPCIRYCMRGVQPPAPSSIHSSWISQFVPPDSVSSPTITNL